MGGRADQEMRNVVQCGVGFLLILFAFCGQGFIEQTVISSAAQRGGISEHAGYRSLGIVYLLFFIGNFIAVPIIEHTSAKWCMTVGAICYVAFHAGFLLLNEAYLYVSSAIVGFGAAILWTAQGNYLTLISTGDNSRRNSGILWAIFQASGSTSGVFLLIVFTFFAQGSIISEFTVRALYSVFTAVNVVGVVVIALLDNPEQVEPKEKPTFKRTLGSTFGLMLTKKMFLLALPFAFTGLSTSLWTGIYPTVISFTTRLGTSSKSLTATYAIIAGVGQILGGCAFGILGEKTKRFGRHNIVLSGMVLHLITFATIFVNFPAEASLRATDDMGVIEPSIFFAMLCGFLLGLCDSIWNTQLYAFLVDNYRSQSSQAFAIFKSYQALCTCSAFFYGAFVNLHWHLAIIAIFSVLGAIGFYRCETIVERERKYSSEIEEFGKSSKSFSIGDDDAIGNAQSV